jgi:hypothetical protein
MNTGTDASVAAACSYCGRANPEQLPACPGCGTPLRIETARPEPARKGKSKGLAVLLALLVGPLGLCYASVSFGLGMFLVAVPAYLITGGGLWFAIGIRVICVFLALMALRETEAGTKPSLAAVRLLNEAAQLENTDRAGAITAYEEIVRQFPGTSASAEAARNIEVLNRVS